MCADRANHVMTSEKDADQTYIDTLWNKQFHFLSFLPSHLQEEIDKKKTVFQKLEELQDQNSGVTSSEDSMLVRYKASSSNESNLSLTTGVFSKEDNFHSLMGRHEQLLSHKPRWHAPWKLIRVINGHTGWVRCVSVDPVDNEWFATGSNDTTIKIWDLASGKLKLTLAGHIMTVRDLAISKIHPYMFSASEDKLVKCWDLERNKSIKDFHGHLSGVHTVDVHPTVNIIASAGRDAVVRIWDIRTRLPVMTLSGHKGPISKVKCFPVDPQIVSCSSDNTVRLWDITAGKAMKVLTHHSKTVRDIAAHPTEYSIATASTDDVRSWRLRDGHLLTNFESEGLGIINSLSINHDDVLFAGNDSGMLSFFDYKTGHKYQELQTTEIPGSLESERGVLASSFDETGLRLITGESDKSIKMWKQIPGASPETHPGLPWNPKLSSQRF